LLVSALFGALPALAQDAVRPSIAGEEAAEARRQDIEHIPYNLVTGPIRYRISATLGFEYNDNIIQDTNGVLLTPSLYANNRDNRYALLDYDKIASRDGYFFVPGKASLLSQTFNHDLLVSIENEEGASQFIKLKLRAKPRKEDEAWFGLDDGHGTRRSYSGARIRENCGTLSGTAGRLGKE
jgi:hypothetical protein